jgi:hypothetical protein
MLEADRVYDEIATGYSLTGFNLPAEFITRFTRYQDTVKPLAVMVIAGCYWSGREDDDLWRRVLERVIAVPVERNSANELHVLGLYPALYLLYAGGVACVLAGKYENLWSLLNVSTVVNGRTFPLPLAIYAASELDKKIRRHLPETHDDPLWLSRHLRESLREVAHAALVDATRFDDAFDRFEYLLGMAHAHLWNESDLRDFWGPVGSFVDRRDWSQGGGASVMLLVGQELEEHGSNWSPLVAGFVNGDLDRLKRVKGEYDTVVANKHLWG